MTTFEDYQPDDPQTIHRLETMARKEAYKLINIINKKNSDLQLITTESLTAGLMISMIIDVAPSFNSRYGGVSVYDTDAKRCLLGVSVDDVYTHDCARQMAIGALNNTTATLSISVTGNAMPSDDELDKLGEVFVGIAGYTGDDIVYTTKKIYVCPLDDHIQELCKKWNDNESRSNRRKMTIKRSLRILTCMQALRICSEFVNKNDLIVPDKIKERIKMINTTTGDSKIHNMIPADKFR